MIKKTFAMILLLSLVYTGTFVVTTDNDREDPPHPLIKNT